MPYPEIITMRLVTLIQIASICLFSSINVCLGQSKADDNVLYAFDSIFKTAQNSPAYVVASKSDINSLKQSLKTERDSLYIKLQVQEKQLSQLKSAPAPVKAQSEKVEVTTAAVATDSPNYLMFQLVIALLVGVVIYFFMKDFSIKKEVKEAKDSYKNLVSEFDEHKKKAIERERKLMRKVIDLQNNLDEKSSPTA